MKVETGVSPVLRVRVTKCDEFDNWYKVGEVYDVCAEAVDTHLEDGGWHPCLDSPHKGIGVGDFEIVEDEQTPSDEYTGSSVSYYKVSVSNPVNPDAKPYNAECNDIIEALGMNFAEGNAFKAIWRSCAARKFGAQKKGYDDGVYDAEKVVFFGQRMLAMAKASK